VDREFEYLVLKSTSPVKTSPMSELTMMFTITSLLTQTTLTTTAYSMM